MNPDLRTFELVDWADGTRPLEERNDISASEFAENCQAGPLCRPFVIRNAVSWPALGAWDVENLQRLQPSPSPVVTLRTTPRLAKNINKELVTMGRTDLSHFLESVRKRPQGDERELYLPGMGLYQFPKLVDQVSLPRVLESIAPKKKSLFLGLNSRCLGHFHPSVHAMLIHVQGHKEIAFYPPKDAAKLSFSGALSDYFAQSDINFYNSDSEACRAVRHIRPFVVRLQPGDALFIPVHWLHVPVAKGWTASVTYWWDAPRRARVFPHPGIRSTVGIARMQLNRRLAQLKKRYVASST